ncbi:putative integral membrane protein [Acetoanaerobium pronyense]|uniref:Integral membrane protein n=1 Tax=Acetoanaerobium pronyense TaxID=1482736 RepID=A0ABS4KL11_9FIRM|nr:LapA family protein [Acetoanaerobium pronyense]MBP2028449.1 putative integral membrane protein [Acetoanaerobium pronyense]
MQWKFILSLVLALLVAIFAIQNSDPVTVSFFITTRQISQALIILLSTVVGAIIALSLGLIKQFALSKKLKEKDRAIRSLETEVASLKIENEDMKKTHPSGVDLDKPNDFSFDKKKEELNEIE